MLFILIPTTLLSNENNNSIKKEKINIAFGFGRAPFMFDKTSQKGIELDIVKKVFENEGIQIGKISQMTMSKQQDIISSKNNDYDVAVLIPQSSENVFYSDEFLAFNNGVITRKKENRKIISPAYLLDLKVAAWDNAHNVLTKEYYELFNPKNAPKNYFEVANQFEQHQLFFSKKVDAIVVDKSIFEYYKNKFKFKYDTQDEEYTFHKIFEPFTGYRVGFKDEKLRDIFNQGLKRIRESKEYDEIIKSYFEVDIDKQLLFTQVMASISSKYILDFNKNELESILDSFYLMPFVRGYSIEDNETKNIFLQKFKKDIPNSYPNNLIIKKDAYVNENGLSFKSGTLTLYFNEKVKTTQIIFPKIDSFEEFPFFTYERIKKIYKNNNLSKESNEKKEFFTLSEEEKFWLKKNSLIKVAVLEKWKPFDMIDENGNRVGFHVDLVKLMNKNMGTQIVLVPYPSWNKAYEDVISGKVHSILSLSYTKEREENYFIYSKPYHFTPYQIVVTKDSSIKTLDHLEDKKIAVRSKSITKKIVEDSIKNGKMNFVDTSIQAYESVKNGNSDATLIANANEELLENMI